MFHIKFDTERLKPSKKIIRSWRSSRIIKEIKFTVQDYWKDLKT